MKTLISYPMLKLHHMAFLMLLALVTSPANAVIELLEFDTEAERARYQVLIDELRCPKCQNQNLADSNAQIAIDLRNKVRDLMEQGKSDEEIKDHLVARYGDFVLYRPQVKSETYVLWYGPFILLALGFVVVIMIIAKNKKNDSAESTVIISDQEREEKLRKLKKENSERN